MLGARTKLYQIFADLLYNASNKVSLRIALDAFCMDQVDADQRFEIEPTIRSASLAESLGLGPVVAEKLLAGFGGSLKLRALQK